MMNIADKYFMSDNFFYNDRKNFIAKGLIVSVVSIHLTRFGTRVILQIIRNKKIIKNFYQGIPENLYVPARRWDSTIRLHDEDAQRFLNQNDIIIANKLYKECVQKS